MRRTVQILPDLYSYKMAYPFVGPPHNLWVGPTNGLHNMCKTSLSLN
jgi:hypothetical protein